MLDRGEHGARLVQVGIAAMQAPYAATGFGQNVDPHGRRANAVSVDRDNWLDIATFAVAHVSTSSYETRMIKIGKRLVVKWGGNHA